MQMVAMPTVLADSLPRRKSVKKSCIPAAHAIDVQTGKISTLAPTVNRVSDLKERLAERVAGDRAISRTPWATTYSLGHMAVWGVLQEQLLCLTIWV